MLELLLFYVVGLLLALFVLGGSTFLPYAKRMDCRERPAQQIGHVEHSRGEFLGLSIRVTGRDDHSHADDVRDKCGGHSSRRQLDFRHGGVL